MNETTRTFALYPDSHPIGSLQEYPPEWMLDLMVDLYEMTIRGDHSFGICHPRAVWLRLSVSSSATCACDGRARWFDVVTGQRFCPGCAEREVAAHDAAQLFRRTVDHSAPHHVDDAETAPLRAVG